jgi:hypothetical protein
MLRLILGLSKRSRPTQRQPGRANADHRHHHADNADGYGTKSVHNCTDAPPSLPACCAQQ